MHNPVWGLLWPSSVEGDHNQHPLYSSSPVSAASETIILFAKSLAAKGCWILMSRRREQIQRRRSGRDVAKVDGWARSAMPIGGSSKERRMIPGHLSDATGDVCF
jgi:hypothetical protein